MKLIYSFLLIAGLCVTGCDTIQFYGAHSLKQIAQMPPFEATVVKINYEQPDIIILLSNTDTGKRLGINIYSANEVDYDFAHHLQEGKGYLFPQILTNFYTDQEICAFK